MISWLKTAILKRIYKLLIIKVVIMDKVTSKWIDKLELFATITIHTDKGDFKFLFKRDRRLMSREENIPIKTYIAELDVPQGVTLKDNSITDKFVSVIKVALFEINPDIMAQVLLDIYLKMFLKN